MDAFTKAETHRDSAYLTTASGGVYRVWFGNEPHPFIVFLTPEQVAELEAFRRENTVNFSYIGPEPEHGFKIVDIFYCPNDGAQHP